jgi:phosphohistidine swiveling domain-containing protein
VRTRYVIELHRARSQKGVGTKAERLMTLHRYGCAVPGGLCCTMEAWRRYRQKDPQILSALRAELSPLVDPSVAYAIRSSADVEDHLESSFAGQFATVLDVRGLDEILKAITTVWESAASASVQSYARKLRRPEENLQMGVIIQRMIQPEFSGVAFSRNPMTGLQEVVVEAIRGRGDALVQLGATPERWVNKWGGWTERPESPTVPESLIREVVNGTGSIEQRFGKPVDLEWVHDGKRLVWLQMREITSLHTVGIYSEKIAREMLPGLIKPLIWSVNIPLVNSVWVRVLTELIGKNSLDARSLARQFYYRAYFNMGAFGEIFTLLGMPRESLELLMGIDVEGGKRPRFRPTVRTLRHAPRMIRFAWDKWMLHTAVDRFIARARRDYAPFRQQQVEDLPPRDVLETIDRLFALNQQTAYYNILVPLLMQMYHRAFKGLLLKLNVDYERFDMTDGSDGAQEFEPNVVLARLHREFKCLDDGLRLKISDATYQDFLQTGGIEAFRSGVEEFLQRFGHLSDIGVDFSAVPWRENPEFVLRMVATFSPPAADDRPRIRFQDLPVKGLRRAWARLLYLRARRFLIYRGQVGSLYTLGYGLFRKYYFALADECVRRGVISQRDDVFYLTHEELCAIIQGGSDGSACRVEVARRRAEMEEFRNADVPTTIYGEEPPPLRKATADSLKGIPTSRGYYRGPVRVIRGMQEYDRLKEGDVLVIPFSDVGLTPLFARAGAVIAESGGILSHSSIIAREYGIPAVVSVSGACRLMDNIIVGVDGYTGDVVIVKGEKGAQGH